MPTVTSEIIIPFRQFVGNAQNPVVYGPYRLDKFTRDNADKIRVWFTYYPTWPAVYPLFSLELYWNDTYGPFGFTFGGQQPIKFGIPQTGVGMIVGIPKLGNTKRDFTYGDITMKAYATFSSDVVIQALLDD